MRLSNLTGVRTLARLGDRTCRRLHSRHFVRLAHTLATLSVATATAATTTNATRSALTPAAATFSIATAAATTFAIATAAPASFAA